MQPLTDDIYEIIYNGILAEIVELNANYDYEPDEPDEPDDLLSPGEISLSKCENVHLIHNYEYEDSHYYHIYKLFKINLG